jgi:hypothetical protein
MQPPAHFFLPSHKATIRLQETEVKSEYEKTSDLPSFQLVFISVVIKKRAYEFVYISLDSHSLHFI